MHFWGNITLLLLFPKMDDLSKPWRIKLPFYPHPGDCIEIEDIRFCFLANPYAPKMVFGVAGQKATVYKIEAEKTGAVMGLKVFEPIFRNVRTADNAQRLFKFSELPGLQVCERTVLTPDNHKDLLATFEDLKYSVVMPWMQGKDWRHFISEMKPLSHDECESIALKTIGVLAKMETEKIAHCDISGGNVKIDLISSNLIDTDIYLVDVEDIFAPEFPQPEEPSYSTPGYNHKEFEQGVWNPLADRFSTAVLIGEILGWCDEDIVNCREDPSYFSEEDMQKNCDRYQNLQSSLRRNWGREIEDAFSEAWFSNTLSQCPTINQWLDILDPNTDHYKEIINKRISKANDFLEAGEIDLAVTLLEETYQLPTQLALTPYILAKIRRGIIKESKQLYDEALQDYHEVLSIIRDENLIEDVEGMIKRINNRIAFKEI